MVKKIYIWLLLEKITFLFKKGEKISFVPFNINGKLLLGFQLQRIDFDEPTSKQ